MMSAESIIRRRIWANSLECVEKQRIQKKYRIPELNKTLVYQRTSKEAKLLCRAKVLGIKVPTVYYVTADTIYMEAIEGPTLLELLKSSNDLINTETGEIIGKCIATLHNNHIVHGDLSPMNIIIKKNTPYLIDFGLSFNSRQVEDFAVDMVAFDKVLNNVEVFNSVLKGYMHNAVQDITKRLEAVRQRGRKK
eukprot:NODE_368_length_10016_cov_0.215791.p5 type:complete len:193 gc:universal NODE_368_length_10016_cov_0.215791:7651-8229(+)